MRETWSYRWSRIVQHNSWAMAIGVTVLLLVMTIPVLSLRLGFSDESNFPENTTTFQAYELTTEGFGAGTNGPLILTAELSGPQNFQTLLGLVTVLQDTDGVARVVGPLPNNTEDPAASQAAIIQVIPTTGPQDAATADLVENLRDTVVPGATDGSGLVVNVSGSVAANIDFSSYLAGRIPLFFAAVLSLSFLLLMMVFRSLLVPLKAVIMNMLSIGAAYGVVVAVFQWGWGTSLLNTSAGPIEPFVPMMLFAIVFGLSMDYEVFLLSRVKEEYDRTGDPVNSVADGLAMTARVITAAAAIMVVVFGSFVFEDNRIIKLFGLGLASAVFLDATLVRMLLVPATMELLGAKNWWLPKWLDRLLPTLNVEGGTHDDHDDSTPSSTAADVVDDDEAPRSEIWSVPPTTQHRSPRSVTLPEIPADRDARRHDPPNLDLADHAELPGVWCGCGQPRGIWPEARRSAAPDRRTRRRERSTGRCRSARCPARWRPTWLQPLDRATDRPGIGRGSRRHEDHAVDELGEDLRIRHGEHGWGVEDDEVELGPDLGQRPLDPVAGEEFGRVRRHVARRDDQQAARVGQLLCDLSHVDFAEQDVRQPLVVAEAEEVVDLRLAEVAVDQQHPLAGLRRRVGEVGRRRRLALAGVGAGDLDHLELLFEGEEPNCGAQVAIRLGRCRARVGNRHDHRAVRPSSRRPRPGCSRGSGRRRCAAVRPRRGSTGPGSRAGTPRRAR